MSGMYAEPSAAMRNMIQPPRLAGFACSRCDNGAEILVVEIPIPDTPTCPEHGPMSLVGWQEAPGGEA